MSSPPSLPPKPSSSNVPILPPKPKGENRFNAPSPSPSLPKKPTPVNSPIPLLPPKKHSSPNSTNSSPQPPPKPQKVTNSTYEEHSQPTTVQQQQQQQQQQQEVETLIPVFPLPEAFTVLPESEMIKLSKSLDVLKGFLITQIEPEKQLQISEINEMIEKIQNFKSQLRNILQQKQETNQALIELQEKVQLWEISQAEMYSSLEKFSPKNVQKILNEAVNDAKVLSDSIETSFLSHVHDEKSTQEFINNYMEQRTLYYMRKEKLERFNEGKIQGL